MNRIRRIGILLGLALVLNVSAQDATPPCLDSGIDIPVINDKVRVWKTTTKNQYLARAHVRGVLSAIYTEQGSHAHFQMELDGSGRDTLEVVYNIDFGKLPPLAIGMEIETCGDYITSNAPTPRYPASPDGAIIHWVHKNPRPGGHESGYLEIDGRVFGN